MPNSDPLNNFFYLLHERIEYSFQLGLVARSDAHLPGNKSVMGSILSFTEIGHEIISFTTLSLPLIKQGSCQLLAQGYAINTG